MLLGRISPIAPIASQATIARATRGSALLTWPRFASRSWTSASLNAHARRRAGIRRQEKDAGSVAGCGEHHAFRDAKLHLPRREVGHHRREPADEILRLVRRLDAGEDDAMPGAAVAPGFADVQRQLEELVRAIDGLRVDDAGDAEIDFGEVVNREGRRFFE